MASKPSSFDKVRSGKLVFKGGGTTDKAISKKKKKTQQPSKRADEADAADAAETHEGREGAEGEAKEADVEGRDTGIGFAPDGRKKTPKYEELFPFETERFAFVSPAQARSREEALDEREKRKSDKYCK